MEELLAKHRKEARDLQSRITSKKKNATKKTRKGANDECAALELALKERHAAEIAALEDPNQANDENGLKAPEPADLQDAPESEVPSESLGNISLNAQSETNGITEQPRRKPNRQKARLARRAAERDDTAAQAAQEAAALPNQKELERKRMLEHIKKHNLQEKEVRADGHCLYAAVADQVEPLGLKPRVNITTIDGGPEEAKGYKRVRYAAADYIEKNPEDFEPFLEEALPEYLRKIRETGEWGGQLELMAIAKTYGVDISVLQADGRAEEIQGEGGADTGKIWLAYYRHSFGLGEHYNSLRKAG